MRSPFLIVSFIGLLVFFSCKEQTTEPVAEPEQKVFENIPSCCGNGENCKTPVVKKNIIGTLKSFTLDLSGEPTYRNITPDEKPVIADSILPFFKWYGSSFDVCNMPEKLKYSTKERRVRLDCIFYEWKWFVPINPAGPVVPQTGGYPTVLTRIELLD
jgi:hypothetical protein